MLGDFITPFCKPIRAIALSQTQHTRSDLILPSNFTLSPGHKNTIIRLPINPNSTLKSEGLENIVSGVL